MNHFENDKELVVEVATVTAIDKKLQDPRSTYFVDRWEKRSWDLQDPYYNEGEPDANHPLGQWSTYTSPEYPAVIYDDGAAFCSPVVTFDDDGRALHFHESLIVADTPSSIAHWNRLTTKKYTKALPYLVGEDGVTSCISGLNVDVTEDYREIGINPIDTTIDKVQGAIAEAYPEVNFISFVSKQYPNQQCRSDIVPDNTSVRGFMFIPRYLATDDTNHLMPVFDQHSREIRQIFVDPQRKRLAK